MGVATSALPNPILHELSRAEFSAYDGNNNLFCYPVVSAIASCQAATFSAFASATHSVTAGPNIAVGVPSSANYLVRVVYQGVQWFFPPNVPFNMPNFIQTILSASEAGNPSPYTVT